METSGFSVTIGKVTYRDFPNYDFLSRLSPDAVKGTILFFQMLGLCNLNRVNAAIGDPEDEIRAKWMLSTAEVPETADENQCEDYRKNTEGIQKKVLGDDDSEYEVSVGEIVNMLQRTNYIKNPQRALQTLLRELQNEKNTGSITTATTANKSLDDEIGRQVAEKAKSCHLAPVYNFQEAKNAEGYFSRLFRFFPNITAEMISAYLFYGSVKRYAVQVAIRDAGLSRSRGFRVKDDSLIERAAFVYWTGGDWLKYYKSGGVIEIPPPPDGYKPGRRPRTPKLPPKVVIPPPPRSEKPAAKPVDIPKAPVSVKVDTFNPNSARTSITITATLGEIQQILALINRGQK